VRECLMHDFNSERFWYAETLPEAKGFSNTDEPTMQVRLATTSSGTLHNRGLETECFSNTDESLMWPLAIASREENEGFSDIDHTQRRPFVATSAKKLHKHGSEDEGISDTDTSPTQSLVTASMEEHEGFSDLDHTPRRPFVATSANKLHKHGSEDEGFSDTDALPSQPLAAFLNVEAHQEKFLYTAEVSTAMPLSGMRSRGMGRRPAQGLLHGVGVHTEAHLGLRAMMTLEDLARDAERAGTGACLGTGPHRDGRAGPGSRGGATWASGL